MENRAGLLEPGRNIGIQYIPGVLRELWGLEVKQVNRNIVSRDLMLVLLAGVQLIHYNQVLTAA